MTYSDTALFIATLGAIAILWGRQAQLDRRRRRDARDMRDHIARIHRKHTMTQGGGLVVLALLMAGGLRAESICGDRTTTPQANRVEVACIDFDALAKLGVPGVSGKRTQVLIHAKYGDAVRVEAFFIDAEGKESSRVKWADLRRDAYQNLAAMPQFHGVNYHRYTIRVLRAE